MEQSMHTHMDLDEPVDREALSKEVLETPDLDYLRTIDRGFKQRKLKAPLPYRGKGRPKLTTRLRSCTEKAKKDQTNPKRGIRCSKCSKMGHNKTTCL